MMALLIRHLPRRFCTGIPISGLPMCRWALSFVCSLLKLGRRARFILLPVLMMGLAGCDTQAQQEVAPAGVSDDTTLDAFALLFFGVYDGMQMFEQNNAMIVVRKAGAGDFRQTDGKIDWTTVRIAILAPCIFHVQRLVDNNARVVAEATINARLMRSYTLSDQGPYDRAVDGLHTFVARIDAADGFLSDGTGNFAMNGPFRGISLLTSKSQSQLEANAIVFQRDICPPGTPEPSPQS